MFTVCWQVDIEYMQTLRAIRDIDQDGVTEDTFHDVSTCLMDNVEEIQTCKLRIHTHKPFHCKEPQPSLINKGMLGVN